MNEIRVTGLLLERYNTRFQGLLHKLIRPAAGTVCSYSNNLANRPVNNSMHRPLKLKIQNALNQVILGDAESRGLFVGGRRRNRKKRRARNVKEKKKARKCDGKGSPVVVRCNNEQAVVPADERPLIESDFDSTLSLAVTDDLHYVDDLPPLIDTEDQENLDPEEMPFPFFKRKNKGNSDKDVILEEEVKSVDGSPAAEQDVATSEQQSKDEHDTENCKTPEEHQNNSGNHDTENGKTPEEHQNNSGNHDIQEAEDATDIGVSVQEPAHEEIADEVVPAVLEVTPVKEQEEITQETEDSQDGTPSEKTAIDEQVGKEVSDEQSKTLNGMKIEESSPLIKKQEPEVDMNFMCCVIL
ncbi:uncharacterized protein LOC110457949 isoform X2 [Mizuhopecten yessoensis]|uniref:uncharacterized protein LOC110457949 isoform X2 n=1 Tax=Mizuhopecten yessoensis TaxID=6573 RepID=UPI000B459834|nr:uncharacterized protein LOC110457949 isoform X2 [Mizuhopecten yessoensis]